MKANPTKFQAISIGKRHMMILSFTIDSVEIKCEANGTLLGNKHRLYAAT